jgi:WD40 repeat protein
MTLEEVMTLLDAILPKPLNDLHAFVFRQAWEGKSYAEMADSSAYDETYIKSVGSSIWKSLSKATNQNVTKSNVRSSLESYARQHFPALSTLQSSSELALTAPPLRTITSQDGLGIEGDIADSRHHPVATLEPLSTGTQEDWGEVMDVSVFFGRTAELQTLRQWVTDDCCRLITVLGMGGMGKTALTVTLAEQVIRREDAADSTETILFGENAATPFRYVIWRSLRNAPPLNTLLGDILQFLSDQREIEASLPRNTSDRIARLLHYLRQSRCLILLDNAESILRGGELSGIYREDYEEYGDLFQRLGETRHQSCVIMTSRERFREITVLEGEQSPVRSLTLTGLGEQEGQAILQQRGAFVIAQQEWQEIVQHYAGNPLALKMVAAAVEDLFGGSVSEFLSYIETQKNSLIFDDIRDLLERQFARLSDLEQEVMYWLAINREFVSLRELREDLVSIQSQQQLAETLRSLGRRSLIESGTTNGQQLPAVRFSQQPVVMEFITEKLIAQMVLEITTLQINGLMRHALMKATAKDYIRQSQLRLIVEPILARLSLHHPQALQSLFGRLLEQLRTDFAQLPGYGAGNLINLLRQLGTDFTDYNFSGLAVWQANLQNLMLHRVNFQHADLSQSLFSETLGGVFRIAFSADGHWLTLGDSNGEISLRQASDGTLAQSWRGHEGVMCGMAFSPRGDLLATASRHIVKLWQIQAETPTSSDSAFGQPLSSATPKLLRTWAEHTGWIRQLAFSPDGTLLATVGNEDQTLRLWDLETGNCRHVLTGHEGAVLSCAFHPTQTIVVSGSSDQTVKFWDTQTGDCLQTLIGQTNHIWSIAFTPDGEILATGDGGGAIELWHLATQENYATLAGHIGLVYSLSISADGRLMASGASEATVRIWDLQTGQCLRVLQEHTNDVFDVAFSPDGKTLVSGSFDHTVRFWDTQKWHCRRTWRGYSNGFCAAVELPDAKLLTGSGDGYLRLWDLKAASCGRKLWAHQGFAWSVAVSPDGQWVASAGEDGLIKLWSEPSGQCHKVLRGHLSAVQAIAFCSSNGNDPSVHGLTGFLSSASSDGTVRLWNLATDTCICTWTGHRSRVWGLAVHPAGHLIASASFDHTVCIWQRDRDKPLTILADHTHWVWGVAFSPDGTKLATASGDHTIKIWDTQTWLCLHTLEGHTSWVQSVGFSPDSTTLVSGSVDTTVKIWDLSTWSCRQTLQGHTNWIYAVAFAADGQTVISSCQDETIKIWDVRTGSCLKSLRADRLYEGMMLTGATGLSDSQKIALQVLGASV